MKAIPSHVYSHSRSKEIKVNFENVFLDHRKLSTDFQRSRTILNEREMLDDKFRFTINSSENVDISDQIELCITFYKFCPFIGANLHFVFNPHSVNTFVQNSIKIKILKARNTESST